MTLKKVIHGISSLSVYALLMGLFLTTSCNSLDTLVVNVEKPAQITLPNNVNTIVIVDNSVPQTPNLGHVEYIRGQKSNAPIRVDIDSLNQILAADLFQYVADKNYYNDVIFYEKPLRADNDFTQILPLDSTLVQDICADNQADALISLDRFLVATAVSEQDYDYGTTIKYMDVRMDVRFKVYDNTGRPISPPLYLNDSIYWTATYSYNSPISETLPTREEALQTAADYVAQKLGDALSPYWDSDLRWYYSDVKEANNLLQNSDWQGALKLWKAAYDKETKNKKKKARLANNIALAYELSDDIKEALNWITVACDLFEQTQKTSLDAEHLAKATEYKDDLTIRNEDFRLLNLRANNAN